jgi:hypothetical protein
MNFCGDFVEKVHDCEYGCNRLETACCDRRYRGCGDDGNVWLKDCQGTLIELVQRCDNGCSNGQCIVQQKESCSNDEECNSKCDSGGYCNASGFCVCNDPPERRCISSECNRVCGEFGGRCNIYGECICNDAPEERCSNEECNSECPYGGHCNASGFCVCNAPPSSNCDPNWCWSLGGECVGNNEYPCQCTERACNAKCEYGGRCEWNGCVCNEPPPPPPPSNNPPPPSNDPPPSNNGEGCPCLYGSSWTGAAWDGEPISNFCHYSPNYPGCPMTSPGGYCDPNGNQQYDDADWVRGYHEYQAQCGG